MIPFWLFAKRSDPDDSKKEETAKPAAVEDSAPALTPAPTPAPTPAQPGPIDAEKPVLDTFDQPEPTPVIDPSDTAPQFGDKSAPSDVPQHMLITTARYPIYYLPITKCGCTYLKNLMHHLDYGTEHPDGRWVHSKETGLKRADHFPDEDIHNSPHAFAVLRDPASRFESLYFDKIYGNGPQNFPHIRNYLATEIGLDLTPNIPLAVHKQNAALLIDWIDENLSGNTPIEKNFHWRPQAQRLRRVAHLNLTTLTLEGLSWQLPLILGDLIPDIEAQMTAVQTRNPSHYPVPKGSILTDDIRAKVRKIYAQDHALYTEARNAWAPLSPNFVAQKTIAQRPGTDKLRVMQPKGMPDFATILVPKAGSHLIEQVFTALADGNSPEYRLVARAPDNGFMIVRDPVERVLSLYFDCALIRGRHVHPITRKRLQNRSAQELRPRVSIAAHRENLMHFIDLLKVGMPRQPGGGHMLYRHQAPIAEFAEERGMKLIPLSHLTPYLDETLPPHEAARDALHLPQNRYASTADKLRDQIVTPALAEAIRNVYRTDTALYARVLAEFEGSQQDGTA